MFTDLQIVGRNLLGKTGSDVGDETGQSKSTRAAGTGRVPRYVEYVRLQTPGKLQELAG